MRRNRCSRRSLNIKQADFKLETEVKKAQADLAYELQQNKIKQSLVTEQVKITQMEAEANRTVREIEVEPEIAGAWKRR